MLFSSSHTPPRPKLEFEAISFVFSKWTNFTLPHCPNRNLRTSKWLLIVFISLWFTFVSLYFTPCLCKPIQDSSALHFMRILPSTLTIRHSLGPMLMFVFHCIVFCYISPACPTASLIPGDRASKNVDQDLCGLPFCTFLSSSCIMAYWLVSKDIIPRYSLYLVIFKSLDLKISFPATVSCIDYIAPFLPSLPFSMWIVFSVFHLLFYFHMRTALTAVHSAQSPSILILLFMNSISTIFLLSQNENILSPTFFILCSRLRQLETVSLAIEQLIHNDRCELFLINTSFTMIITVFMLV